MWDVRLVQFSKSVGRQSFEFSLVVHVLVLI